MSSINTKHLLSASDMMELGFSRSMTYQLLNRRDFPAIKIGRRLFVKYDSLMEWLEAHENSATE